MVHSGTAGISGIVVNSDTAINSDILVEGNEVLKNEGAADTREFREQKYVIQANLELVSSVVDMFDWCRG